MTRATVKAVKDFFESGDSGRKVSMTELKDLKNADGYDAIADGIGDETFTY